MGQPLSIEPTKRILIFYEHKLILCYLLSFPWSKLILNSWACLYLLHVLRVDFEDLHLYRSGRTWFSADYKCVISSENICTQPELSPFPPSLPNSTLANLRDLRVWQQTPGLDPVSTLPSGILSMFNYEKERVQWWILKFWGWNISIKFQYWDYLIKRIGRLHYLC